MGNKARSGGNFPLVGAKKILKFLSDLIGATPRKFLRQARVCPDQLDDRMV